MMSTFFQPASSEPDEQRRAARALLALPLIVSAAGGRVDAENLDRTLSFCILSPVVRSMGPQETEDIAGECLAVMRELGSEELFSDVIVGLALEMAESAMCLAIAVAVARGPLDEARKGTLRTMGQRLGLPEATFIKIFDVMNMLSRQWPEEGHHVVR